MNRTATALLAFTAAWLLAPALADAKPLKNGCFGKFERPLRQGGFTGDVENCADFHELSIKRIGRLTDLGGHTFLVYDWNYVGEGGSQHGGRRILIFTEDMRYMGQYAVSVDGRIWIDGSRLRTNGPKRWGNVVPFTKNGPPRHAYLDAELDDFFR
ncbi:MAG TPA: hypothetical protein VG960_02725 [Caulobacteraceae bacterium]|nr:hypothetical protein [Caulobacteraceae bacterium]